jgi:hypothetical protein
MSETAEFNKGLPNPWKITKINQIPVMIQQALARLLLLLPSQ